MRIATLALAAFLGSGLAQAADNAATEIWFVADLPGSDQEYMDLEGSSPKKSVSWTSSATRGTATTAANAAGTAEIHATTSYETADGETNGTVASATLWGGDVLTIRVPGAKPGTRTRLKFTVMTHTSLQRAVDWTARGLANYCLGWVECLNSPAPDWVLASLDLPMFSGIQAPMSGLCQGNEQDFSCTDKLVVMMRGTEATVPLMYQFCAWANAGPNAPFDPLASVDGTFKWTLQLPEGATCTSRTGLIFRGLCPKATS